MDKDFDKAIEKEAGKKSPKPKKTDKDKEREVSYFENENYILEQIKNTTHTTHLTQLTEREYIKYSKDSGSVEQISSFEHNGILYKPIIDDLYEKNAIVLPSGVEEYGNDKKLVSEIREFFNSYFEVPKFFEEFLPYLCLFYWVYDKFPFVPYIHFVGRTSTGKTTAMEVFGSLCYKPIDASGAITMASIFRTASTWRGTLLLDEFESAGQNYKEMLAFLKSGVGDKAVLRTEGDSKREVRAYVIKSPKVFTSENPINNAGLQSRTLVIQMQKNKRRIPLYRLKNFIYDSERLRNKLLLWRLRNLNDIDLRKIEYGFKNLRVFDRRVQQVITPIYYLSDKETKKTIIKFAKEQQEETLRERREALDGQIFQSIYESMEKGEEPSISTIYEYINGQGEKTKRYPTSERKIGSVVRKILGFDIVRKGTDNVSTIIVEEAKDQLKELCAYYGLEFKDSLYYKRVESVESDEVAEVKEIFGA